MQKLKSLFLAGFICSAGSLQAEIPAVDKVDGVIVEYYVFNQNISDFFGILERDTNLRFQISPNVRGTLNDMSFVGDPLELLDKIATTWGLDWYAFNKVIHVSPKSDAGTRVVRLGDLSPADAIAALSESGLPMDRFPAQIAGQGSALVFSGPPTLLALAEAVIETIPERPEMAGPVLPPGKTVIVRRGVETQVVPIQ